MESRRKRSRSQLLKWGCYVLALFVCAALQTTPGLFQLGQAKPLLVLPLCLAVAVFEGEFAGALLGTVGGLLWDYAAGRLILAEAGGQAEALDGGQLMSGPAIKRGVIAAASPALFAEWSAWIKARS